ncbi:MAG: hypothetical protein HY066_06995 [Betaproteobacteria bacterium]|nr:hypothetical protein [Betaproteobacteria bacterium]
MSTTTFRKGLWLLHALFACAAQAATTHAQAAGSLDFDNTFNAKGAPQQAHFLANYTVNGARHTVEVWRDKDQHLKRRTDDAIETYLVKPANDPEWRMTVVDLKRKILTNIDRSNLYRVGHFTDWFGLAHALTHPVGSYTLTRTTAPGVTEKPITACKWYALAYGGVSSDICWSHSLRLPMLITGKDGVIQWRITQVDAGPVADDTFRINTAGYVLNDANSDIKGD